MLYEIARELGAYFTAHGVPYPVVHGPGDGGVEARPVLSTVRGRVVLERNRKGSELFTAPRSAQRIQIGNSKAHVPMSQRIECLARVVVQSTLPGAALHDHEEECDRLVRHTAIGLRHVIVSRKHPPPEFRGHMLTVEERKLIDYEHSDGVVYELEFAIERGLFESDWTGAGQPLGAITEVAHTGCADG